MTLKSAAVWTGGKLLALVVFVAISLASCSGVFVAAGAVFFPAQTDFAGGTPPDFMVVVEDPQAKDPHDRFRTAPLQRVPELLKSNHHILRLSRKEYSSEAGDPWRFKVIEETAQAQVVELRYRNTSGIDARYRVEGDRITPLYYKTDGGMGLTMMLLPVFLACLWLALWAARRAERWLRPAGDAARTTTAPTR